MGETLGATGLGEEFDIVFNSCNEAFFLVEVSNEKEVRFLSLNDTYEQLTGFRTSNLKGKTTREVFGDKRGGRLQDHFQQCIDNHEKVSFEESLVFPEGDKHFVTELNPVVKRGRVVRIVGASRVFEPGGEKSNEGGGLAGGHGQIEMEWPGKTSPVGAGLDALAMADETGKIFYVNEDFLKIFGYNREDEALGRHPFELMTTSEHRRSRKFLEMVENEGFSRREVKTLENKSHLFDVKFDLSSLQRGAGSVSCTMISFEGMEEKDKREMELKLAHSSVDNAPLGIFWITPEGKLEYVNNRACEMLGYSRDELIERNLSEVDLNFSVEVREKRWNEIKRDQNASFESRFLSGDGNDFPVEVTGRYLEYKEREYEIAFVRDITQRKKKERKLKLTQFSVENAGVGVFWVDPDGQFEYVNKTTCEMLDYSRNELVGKSISDVDPGHSPSERENYWQKLQKTQTNKFETRLETKHGEIFPAEVISRYLEFRGQKYEFAFVQDISARKKKEEELQAANKQLAAYTDELEETEQKLREEVKQRKKSHEKLKKSLEEKEILQQEVHHRVKNNLFLIISILDMQRLDCERPEVKEMLAECTNRIHSMALVHQKIYTAENIEKLDFSSYLRVLVGELADSYARPEQDIELGFDIESSPLNLDRIIPCGLVVNELVSNAFQHGFEGHDDGVLEVKYFCSGDQYHIEIANSGNSLPQDFELSDIDSLGLKLVRRLVFDQLVGDIEYETDSPVTFKITFPIEPDHT